MSKPICVIKLREDFVQAGHLFWPEAQRLQDHFEKKMPDYYTFVLPAKDQIDMVELQVFHEKNFNEIQYAELKKMIMDSLPKSDTNV